MNLPDRDRPLGDLARISAIVHLKADPCPCPTGFYFALRIGVFLGNQYIVWCFAHDKNSFLFIIIRYFLTNPFKNGVRLNPLPHGE
jgi:hypothetical protein